MPLDPPNIPALSQRVDPEVKKAIAAISDWFSRGQHLGGLVPVNDLLDAIGSTGSSLSQFIDSTIPPPIANFAVAGALRSIMLTWDDPQYKRFSCVEIWRAGTDDLGAAVKIDTTLANLYGDLPPNSSLAVTYYYWVRIVSTSGIIGPFNSTAGTPGSTGNDPGYLLEILSDQIGSTQLNSDLNDSIALVNTPTTGLVDKLASLSTSILDGIPDSYGHYLDLKWQQAVTDAVIEIDPATGKIRLVATAEITTDVEHRVTVVEHELDSANGTIVSHTNTLATHGTAITDSATLIGQQQAQLDLMTTTAYVDGKISEAASNLDPASIKSGQDAAAEAEMWAVLTAGNVAHAQMQYKANADAISAESDARLTLAAKVDDGYAALLVEQSTRASEDAALSESITTLVAAVGQNTAGLIAEQSARATAVSAVASSVTTLTASVEEAAADATAAGAAAGDAGAAATAAGVLATAASAAIVAEQSARATAVSAVASSVTTLQSTVGDHTSSISTQQTAINGLSASYVVKVGAGGKVAGFGIASDTTTGSAFNILADRFSISNTSGTGSKTPFIVDPEYGVIMDTAFIKNLTAAHFVGGAIHADTVAAGISIVTPTLTAATINAAEIDASSEINGSAINGARITGGRIQTTDGHVVIENNTITVTDATGAVRVKIGYLG